MKNNEVFPSTNEKETYTEMAGFDASATKSSASTETSPLRGIPLRGIFFCALKALSSILSIENNKAQ